MTKSPSPQVGIIFETFTPVGNDEIIFLENTVNSQGIPKAKFKVRLQTLEEKNGNNRFYDMSIGRAIIEGLSPKTKSRRLLMEIDHPMLPTGTESEQLFAKRRSVTVELKNCGALISELDIHNKDIIGLAETLTGFKGPDFYNVIVNDKVDIGFSLRMFGQVRLDESTGLNRVVGPIRPITYDIVTDPSHKSARILEFMTENINTFLTDDSVSYTVLQEGAFDCDGIQCASSNEDVYEYLNSVLNSTFKTMGPVEFRF